MGDGRNVGRRGMQGSAAKTQPASFDSETGLQPGVLGQGQPPNLFEAGLRLLIKGLKRWAMAVARVSLT